ncbi:type IV secretory system conjugative DNA transfer family protein [Acaryochloris marina NIES-2412]|uniref:type IV secretory system conjugative DNA transfer family protein n=1 Tax=Acaryochloris marina TaxID=155978 RepID=UPI0040594286
MSKHIEQPASPPPEPAQPRQSFWSIQTIAIMGVLLLAFLFFSHTGISKTKTKIPKGMPDARVATKKEIQDGINWGKRQRAAGVIGEKAVRLNRETGLILADVAPGGVIPGASNMGKTANGIVPVIESHAEDEDTLIIGDIKGDLLKETAPYLRSLGYKIFVIAPGIDYPNKLGGTEPIQISNGLNLTDFLKDGEDAEGVLQISRALNLNTTKDPEKRHQYFGPQGDAAQEFSLMLAKSGVYADLLMSWEILGLDRLAERLQAAYEAGAMDGEELPYYASHRSRGMRTIAKDKGQSNPGPTIQSTASQMLGKFIGPSIAKCLLKTTVPLDLEGKTAVYFRIDEDNIEATAPLVATMMHMLIRRNISNRRKRTNHLAVILDEASTCPLPSLHEWSALNRSNGLVVWLAYQQEAQMKFIYGDKWEIIRSNLRTVIAFNQGGRPKAGNDVISESLGKQTIISKRKGNSNSDGKNTNSSNDNFEQIPLLSADEIGRMNQKGCCIIINPGFSSRPLIYKDKPLPYALDGPIHEERQRLKKVWEDEMIQALQEQHQADFEGIDVKRVIEARTELAELILPEPETYEDDEDIQEIANSDQAVEALTNV